MPSCAFCGKPSTLVNVKTNHPLCAHCAIVLMQIGEGWEYKQKVEAP